MRIKQKRRIERYSELVLPLIKLFANFKTSKEYVDLFKEYRSAIRGKPANLFESEIPPMTREEALRITIYEKNRGQIETDRSGFFDKTEEVQKPESRERKAQSIEASRKKHAENIYELNYQRLFKVLMEGYIRMLLF